MKPDIEPVHHHVHLFKADSSEQHLDLSTLGDTKPAEEELLWIDLHDPDDQTMEQVFDALSLDANAREEIAQPSTTPGIGKANQQFWIRVAAVSKGDGLKLEGSLLVLAAGENWVLTVHRHPIDFIDRLRKRESAGSDIGHLRAESFVAALLDWQLSTYFRAAADFEVAIERLEVGILGDETSDCLPEMRRLRKAASRMRRMLAPHRTVFGGLSRPDFRPNADEMVNRHFAALDMRFERAMDTVENARELVIGSFELLSSQTALKTNTSMRTLTFATVITGVLAVVAGILGMNFNAPFFKTQTVGFALAAGAMLTVAGLALWWGRRRSWF
jgi:Mg2+ and Co2+ transporter CorA